MAFLSCIIKPLAYLSLPVLILQTMSITSPTMKHYSRIFVYLGTVVTAASTGLVAAVGLSLVGQPHNVNWCVARVFYALASRLLEVTIELEGEEYLESTPAVIMCNHQSMLDLLLLGRVMPKQTAIMAKKSLRFSPMGPFMMMSGAIFIDRGNNARAVRSLEEAVETMHKHRISLIMFPEGTRRNDPIPDVLPFKKGGFHLAIQAGIPILPIVTENYWHIYHSGHFLTGKIKARVLPPIRTTGLTAADVNDLVKRVRDQMLETHFNISDHARSSVEMKAKEAGTGSSETTSSPLPTVYISEKESGFSGASIAVNPSTPSVDHSVQSRLGMAQDSIASLASSTTSSQQWKSTASETGGETEEDEGMVLVGRPH